MKVRKAIQRIVALATGATMMGATMMGAFGAADMADFPKPMFISDDGTFDGIFVVGSAAQTADVLVTSDIRGSVQAAAVRRVPVDVGAEEVTTVEGDSFLVAASGNDLNFNETLTSVQNIVDSGDLASLAGGTFSNQKGSFDYNQYIVQPVANVFWTDDSDASEDPADYLVFPNNVAAWTYRLEFPTAAKSDVDSSSDLDDFDNKDIAMLGQEYSFVNTELTSANRMTLELMSGAITDTLSEGETKTYTVNDADYEITLDYVSTTQVRFTVNGESTDLMVSGDTYTTEDGTELGVKNILPQNRDDETMDTAEFYFGATKLYLRDTSVADDAVTAGTGTVKVGSDTITDADVDLIWSNVTVASGLASEIALSQIDIFFLPSDDVFVAEGQKLTEEVASSRGDSDWVKLHDAVPVDIIYSGTLYGELDEVKLKPSGSTKIELEWMNKAGEQCDINLLYLSSSLIYLQDGSDASKNYSMREISSAGTTAREQVFDEGYFFIEKNEYSRVMKAKKVDRANTELTLYDECAKESTTISYTPNETATFYKDGNSFQILVDDSVGTTAYVLNLTDITDDSDGIADLYTKNKHQIMIDANLTNASFKHVNEGVNISVYESPTVTRDESGTPVEWIGVNVTQSSSKITPSGVQISGSANTLYGGFLETTFLISLDSVDDKTQGKTKWGTLVEHDTSGDQDKVTMWLPENEAKPQVHLTTGSVSTSTGVGGTYTEEVVLIPTRTMLDTEVSGIWDDNMIVVGGPCVNTVAAGLLGNPADCTEGFTPGSAKVKLFEGPETVAMLVAGYSADDTRRAGDVVFNYAQYTEELVGDEVEVYGTTLDDINVRAPLPPVEEAGDDDTGNDTGGEG